jgi:hypothetical protein
VRERFPDANIESQYYQNDVEMVRLYGKGYGEGEIVNHAIDHSTYLRELDYFAKCTAELWVDNFLECVSGRNGSCLLKGYFADVFSFKPTRFDYIDTHFYLVSKLFYSKYLASTYLHVDSDHGVNLEYCFRDVVLEHGLSKILFIVPPVIFGVGCGSGTYYKNNLKRRIMELVRLRMVINNRTYAHLFV